MLDCDFKVVLQIIHHGFLVAHVSIELANDAFGDSHSQISLFKEVRPFYDFLSNSIPCFRIDKLAMFCGVDSNRLLVGQLKTVLVPWTISPNLIAQSSMMVGNLTKAISTKEKDHVVSSSFVRRLVNNTFWLFIVARIFHLVLAQIRDQLFIP